MTVFEAYITNLGKYAEGRLVGETLKFPATTEEVQSLLKNIGVDGVRYAPTFSCRPMHRKNTQTVRPYGTPWKKPSVERRHSLHTALTLLCRMNFPLRKTSLLQGNFYWRTL